MDRVAARWRRSGQSRARLVPRTHVAFSGAQRGRAWHRLRMTAALHESVGCRRHRERARGRAERQRVRPVWKSARQDARRGQARLRERKVAGAVEGWRRHRSLRLPPRTRVDEARPQACAAGLPASVALWNVDDHAYQSARSPRYVCTRRRPCRPRLYRARAAGPRHRSLLSLARQSRVGMGQLVSAAKSGGRREDRRLPSIRKTSTRRRSITSSRRWRTVAKSTPGVSM